MIINRDRTLMHRLVIACHKDDKMLAYELEKRLKGIVEMSVVKDMKSTQDFDTLFNSFTAANDIVVVFMTSRMYDFVSKLLNRHIKVIRKRALMVMPVLMGIVEKEYSFFTSLPTISCSENLGILSKRVSEVISNYLRINLGNLKFFDFENLVKDVLKTYDFKNITLSYSDFVDFGYDLMCSYVKESDKGILKENWLVEIKYTNDERFTIRKIHDLIYKDRKHYMANNKVMLVTNGTLTSVIVDYIEELEKKQKLSIFIVDGWKLCNLIAMKVNLINEYFPHE